MRNKVSVQRVSMPKWPAWVLFGIMAACAYPAVTASAGAAERQRPEAAAQPGSFASAFAR